jgi:hypothetical protein
MVADGITAATPPAWNAFGIGTPSRYASVSRGLMPRTASPPSENGTRATSGNACTARSASPMAPGIERSSSASRPCDGAVPRSGALSTSSITSSATSVGSSTISSDASVFSCSAVSSSVCSV